MMDIKKSALYIMLFTTFIVSSCEKVQENKSCLPDPESVILCEKIYDSEMTFENLSENISQKYLASKKYGGSKMYRKIADYVTLHKADKQGVYPFVGYCDAYVLIDENQKPIYILEVLNRGEGFVIRYAGNATAGYGYVKEDGLKVYGDLTQLEKLMKN